VPLSWKTDVSNVHPEGAVIGPACLAVSTPAIKTSSIAMFDGTGIVNEVAAPLFTAELDD
jgi:hypothetical protein